MDPSRFDHLAKEVATNRRSVMRGAAGGGFLGLVGILFGRGNQVSAQTQPTTCTWEIEAQGSVGPNQSRSINGIMTVTVESDGSIDKGKYVLVDQSWNPLVDNNGDVIAYDVFGSSHLRSIDFRLERDGCEHLDFTGVNRHFIIDCMGPMSGSCHGPELIDHGGWRTRRPNTCTACRGTTCPPNYYLDSESCECVRDCPRDTAVCDNKTCVPDQCPQGTWYDESRCVCSCDPRTCEDEELWCPAACDCLPWKPCTGFECPPGYVHSLTGKGGCTCTKDPCKKTCSSNEIPIYNGEACTCVPTGGCKAKTCESGYSWDTNRCECVQSCQPKTCQSGYAWDNNLCRCVQTCQPKSCKSGSTWDSSRCECVSDCKETSCDNGYAWDKNRCKCVVKCEKRKCDSGYVWDRDRCKCVANCEERTCDSGYVWDPDYCECVVGCDERTCDSGYHWDWDRCDCVSSCEEKTCGSGKKWNPDYCDCMCYDQCHPNYQWDYDHCSCVCTVKSCDPGYVLNQKECACFPSEDDSDKCSQYPCYGFQAQDPQTCECYCPEPCYGGQEQAQDCSCYCVHECGEGQTQGDDCACYSV